MKSYPHFPRQTIRRTLRPDVAQLVHRLIAQAPRPDSSATWWAYSNAKGAISRLCGWDAPAHSYDQFQFDLAVHAYGEGNRHLRRLETLLEGAA